MISKDEYTEKMTVLALISFTITFISLIINLDIMITFVGIMVTLWLIFITLFLTDNFATRTSINNNKR
jgi:hypothetical protein